MDFKALLNEQQLAPVEDTEGAVLVLAGAGSGKTRVLTYRIAYLIQNKNVEPYNILAITFTNKAAKEMKERVEKIVGQSNVLIATFHAFCAKILRAEIGNLEGYNSNFSIYDDGDCNRIISRILKDMEIEDAKDLKKDIRWNISNAKNHALSPKDYAAKIKGERNGIIIASVFEQYENQLKQNNALDFDDLLLKTVMLFAQNKEVLLKYQERFKYLMVDEFQDTNKIQYTLIRLLSAKYGNVFVVGDDDQSIYGWRWAEVENIINFKKHFAGARVYKLEQNYRSTGNILNLANKIIDHNQQRMGKTLWTKGEDGVKVVYSSCYNERSEADFVVGQINSLVLHNDFSYKDFAVLVRANSITRTVEEKLTLYNFPYRVIGGSKFYERKEIKDILAYLKLVVNPRDTESIFRVINTPKRGIGEGAVEKLMQACRSKNISIMDGILNLDSLDLATGIAKKLSAFADVVENLIEAKSMPLDLFVSFCRSVIKLENDFDKENPEDKNRIDNIDDFIHSTTEFYKDNDGCSIEEYLQSVALISSDEGDKDDNVVTVATVHGVKGLEFRCVFIIGLEEGLFPSLRCGEEDIQEERRIMYVAVTRARERLYLTNAQSRFRYGKTENSLASRFLKEGEMIKERLAVGDDVDFAPRKAAFDFSQMARQSASFSATSSTTAGHVGNDISQFLADMVVEHTRFGVGRIVEITGENAKISFDGLGVKVFNLRLAPLKIVK